MVEQGEASRLVGPVALARAVEDELAVDPGLPNVRVDREGRSGKEDEVSVLAALQRAKPIIEVHHGGGVNGQRPKRLLLGETATDGDGAGAEEEPGLGDGV